MNELIIGLLCFVPFVAWLVYKVIYNFFIPLILWVLLEVIDNFVGFLRKKLSLLIPLGIIIGIALGTCLIFHYTFN